MSCSEADTLYSILIIIYISINRDIHTPIDPVYDFRNYDEFVEYKNESIVFIKSLKYKINCKVTSRYVGRSIFIIR